MTSANPFAEHELRAPRLTLDEAASVARRSFGLEGELHELDSHQDQNFRLDAPQGRFVLKIANEAFTFEELDLQNRAMEHVAARLPAVTRRPLLDVLAEERLQDNAREVGEYLTERVGALVDQFELVRALHGIGLYRGLELANPDGRPAGAAARAICERMLGLGVVIQPTGPDRNVLKLKPPLCVTAADVDFLAAALAETLATGW